MSSNRGLAGIVVGGGVNVQRSLHLQYYGLGALEQGTEPQTAAWVPQHITAPGVCVCVCVYVLWMGNEFRVWVPNTWPYVTSLSLFNELRRQKLKEIHH